MKGVMKVRMHLIYIGLSLKIKDGCAESNKKNERR